MGIFDEFKENVKEQREKQRENQSDSSLGDALDFTHKKLWKSVDVIEREQWDEPKVLQQVVKYPTSSTVTETKAPMDKHRLVPLSELVTDS